MDCSDMGITWVMRYVNMFSLKYEIGAIINARS